LTLFHFKHSVDGWSTRSNMQTLLWLNLIPTALLQWLFLGFCLATAFQLLFYVLVIFRGWHTLFQKNSQAHTTVETPVEIFPPVSLIVCARNEAVNLEKHLPLLLNQHDPGEWELIVVDDASEDDSVALLHGFQTRYKNLRVLRIKEKKASGKKDAMHLGIASARFEHLVFTDADCAPTSPEWLLEMVRCFTRPEIDIVLGFAPLNPREGLLGRWAAFETTHTALLFAGCAAAGLPYMGVGRNMAWKKPVFERSGGFSSHAHLSSGDDDLLVNSQANAQNTAICMSSKAFMYSEPPKDWSNWFRQKRRQLGASGQYRIWHKMMLGAIAGAQVFHYFFGFLLLISGYLPALVLVGCLIRLCLLSLVYRRAFRHLHAGYLLVWLPLLDFMQACYNGLIVPYSLLVKSDITRWK
jgi:biofilm PGA synthesis N-glycosyltransferase PgaC